MSQSVSQGRLAQRELGKEPRPFPDYNITGPPDHDNKRFNVSARSNARRPTNSDSSFARCTKNSLIIAAVVATVTATAVAAASSFKLVTQ